MFTKLANLGATTTPIAPTICGITTTSWLAAPYKPTSLALKSLPIKKVSKRAEIAASITNIATQKLYPKNSFSTLYSVNEGANTLRFQCQKCNKNIDVTKKMKNKKNEGDV